jgi:hypothetical protein
LPSTLAVSTCGKRRPLSLSWCERRECAEIQRARRPGDHGTPAASRAARDPSGRRASRPGRLGAAPITRPTLVEYRVEQRTAKLEQRSARLRGLADPRRVQTPMPVVEDAIERQ